MCVCNAWWLSILIPYRNSRKSIFTVVARKFIAIERTRTSTQSINPMCWDWWPDDYEGGTHTNTTAVVGLSVSSIDFFNDKTSAIFIYTLHRFSTTAAGQHSTPFYALISVYSLRALILPVDVLILSSYCTHTHTIVHSHIARKFTNSYVNCR